MKYSLDYKSRFRILKGGKISLVVSALLTGVSLLHAAPSGGVVTSGTANIAQSGSVTTINQSTQKASINWQNFSIGKSETVNFNQPSVSAITLNRVVGNEKSIIEGTLNANGQVWILNSNGVLFNSSAKVNTAGLLATTKALSDEDFQKGEYSFKGESSASVINLGEITINNSGYAALLANTVQNEGSIKAIHGTVHLTGASEATINLNGNSLVSLKVDKGVLDALVENRGAIYADGGNVYLTTNAVNELLKGVVNNTGIIEANSLDDITGEIILFAHGGTTTVSGTLEAKEGFIETSGDVFAIASDTLIAAKTWLIDPTNLTISDATAYNTALNGGTDVVIETSSAGFDVGDITLNSAISKTSGGDATLTMRAANSIIINESISSTTGALHVNLDADNNQGSRDGGGIVILNNDITTNGGNLNFGTGATLTLNGVSTKVGGDVYVGGTTTIALTTSGGDINVNGEMIIANTNDLEIATNGGNVLFGGLVNSGNSYESVSGSTNWSNALSNAKSGNGDTVGDTYLATITSRLENAIAGKAVNYQPSWLGARRVTGIGTNSLWRWVSGPEGLMDEGKGLGFFTQSGSGGGSAYNGGYSNWNSGEPNNWNGSASSSDFTTEGESVLQFTGSIGQWNDLTGGPIPYGNTPQTLNYYVKETNLATSPLSINAGSGTVTFSGAVGNTKSLKSLDVTASTTAINGGVVTTEGLQTYTSNITLGSASTVLSQTDAGMDFTLQSGKTIINAYGNNATFTLKTTEDIILNNGSSLSSLVGALNTILWSNSGGTGGYIRLNSATITTNGGNLWMGGGSESASWNGLTVGNGSAIAAGGGENGISLSSSLVSTGIGNIYMYGQSTDNSAIHSDGIDIDYANTTSIQTTSGSITLIGDAGDFQNSDGIRVSGSILSQTGAISLTGYASAGASSESIALEKASISSTSGNITLNSDIFWMSTDIGWAGTISSSGVLSITPTTASRTIGIGGGAGLLSLASTYFSSNFFDGFEKIVIGSANQTGNITFGSVTLRDALTLNTQGSVTQSGAITGNQALELLGTSATYTLTNTSNDVATLSANTGSMSYIDSNALTLGSITATGTIDIATLSGDMRITGNIATTDTTSSAITLNAGKSADSTTVTGGNIIKTAGALSTGVNGVTRLFSGSVADSTGIGSLASSENKRYTSDETTVFNPLLDVSDTTYVIYRDAEPITPNPSTPTMTPDVTAIVNGTTLQIPRVEFLFTPSPLSILASTPLSDVPNTLMSLAEVQQTLALPSSTDIRIPLGQNSLIQLINGGVRLPEGLEQEFFMAQN